MGKQCVCVDRRIFCPSCKKSPSCVSSAASRWCRGSSQGITLFPRFFLRVPRRGLPHRSVFSYTQFSNFYKPQRVEGRCFLFSVLSFLFSDLKNVCIIANPEYIL